MSDVNEYEALLKRISQGDNSAVDEFFRDYWKHVLRVVRFHMQRNSRLRGHLESADVCQSVLLELYREITSGKRQLSEPKTIGGLITVMVQHKLADHAEKLKAARRDVRRTASQPVEEFPLASREVDPGRELELQDLAERIEARLSMTERELLAKQREGQSWDEISVDVGKTPEAARKCVARLLARMERELLE